MSRRTVWVMSSAVLVLLLAVGAVGTLAAPGSDGGNPSPMIKGTVKWFNDAIIVPINNLLSGTGLTIDRYEGPRLDGIGIRIEPPLGVLVTDNNNPPKNATAPGGKMPRPAVTKKIVGTFQTEVAFAAAPGGEPWAVMTATNAGVAETYDWGISLFSLPPGGLLVQLGSEYYQLTADGTDVMHLEEVSLSTVPPVPGGPGVLNRRVHDHIGNYNCIEVAGQLLAGWPPQQATKKIVGWRSGIDLDAALGPGGDVIVLRVVLRPERNELHAVPGCGRGGAQESPIGFLKVDLVSARDGEPLATMDCPEPEAGAAAASAPYVLELSEQGGILPIYDDATGNGCLLTWQPATATSAAPRPILYP